MKVLNTILEVIIHIIVIAFVTAAAICAVKTVAFGCEKCEYPNEYAEVFAEMSQEDFAYLAKAVMCEAGYTNIECAEGCVCVILNRVICEEYGSTVTEVVLEPGQFSTKPRFKYAKPNSLVYTAIANVQNHGARVIRNELAEQGWDFLSTDYVFFAVFKQGYADSHIWIGLKENEKAVKNQGHWLGRKSNDDL